MDTGVLFQPLQIGPVTIPNRIARAAHGTYFFRLGEPYVGASHIAYHQARAAHGVGLTVLDGVGVHPSGGNVVVLDGSVVERYQQLAAAVHPHGMKLFQQVFHPGHERLAVGGSPPWGVSTVPSASGTVAWPMTREQIDEVVAAFANAAGYCARGGLDGIELNATYLPSQFLSPLLNDRSDEFGGSLENRMRFLRLALGAMRDAADGAIAVGVRLSASAMPGLLPSELLEEVVGLLEDDGLIDFLSTSMGDHYSGDAVRGMDAPSGYQLASVGKLIAATAVPSIVTGRFRTLDEAAEVISSGAADMVSMVRALIADEALITKTLDGRADDVRPCIACNQGCFGNIALGGPMSCTVNPVVGFESTKAESMLERVDKPGRVLVVGGGPAGLEAARLAALRGHQVVLADAGPRLGGALNFAYVAPRHELMGDIVAWLVRSVEAAGVEVRLGTIVTEDNVAEFGADAVIVATGSTPRKDGLQHKQPGVPATGVEQSHVLSSRDLLADGVPARARTALVADSVGGLEGIAVADALVDAGLSVTYLTDLPMFGNPVVQATGRAGHLLEYLYAGDFTVLARYHLVAIDESSCRVQPLGSHTPFTVPADLVVLVNANEPLRGLYQRLLASGAPRCQLIGDAATPRDLQAAIREGNAAGRSVLAAVSESS